MQKWKCLRESVTFIDKDMAINGTFCTEDAQASVKEPDRASHYANALNIKNSHVLGSLDHVA